MRQGSDPFKEEAWGVQARPHWETTLNDTYAVFWAGVVSAWRVFLQPYRVAVSGVGRLLGGIFSGDLDRDIQEEMDRVLDERSGIISERMTLAARALKCMDAETRERCSKWQAPVPYRALDGMLRIWRMRNVETRWDGTIPTLSVDTGNARWFRAGFYAHGFKPVLYPPDGVHVGILRDSRLESPEPASYISRVVRQRDGWPKREPIDPPVMRRDGGHPSRETTPTSVKRVR